MLDDLLGGLEATGHFLTRDDVRHGLEEAAAIDYLLRPNSVIQRPAGSVVQSQPQHTEQALPQRTNTSKSYSF